VLQPPVIKPSVPFTQTKKTMLPWSIQYIGRKAQKNLLRWFIKIKTTDICLWLINRFKCYALIIPQAINVLSCAVGALIALPNAFDAFLLLLMLSIIIVYNLLLW